MTIKERIIRMYPSLTEEDIGLKDEGDGIVLSYWNSSEPKPSDEQIRQWETETFQEIALNPPKTEVEILKEQQELMQKAIDDIILGVM